MLIQAHITHLLGSLQVWLQCSQVPTPLQPFGKRAGQWLVVTSAAGCSDSRLFYIRDKNSGLRFLVDTGGEISIIPVSGPPRMHRATGYSLQAVNQSSIATFGTRPLTLNRGLRHPFQWIFIVADVTHAILGFPAPLWPVCGHTEVTLHQHTNTAPGQWHAHHIHLCTSIHPIPSQDPYSAVLVEFPDILCSRGTDQPAQHTITHHICTTGPLVSARPRRLPLDCLRLVKEEFDHMLDLGIVQLLGITAPHGAKEVSWRLAPLRRLSCP